MRRGLPGVWATGCALLLAACSPRGKDGPDRPIEMLVPTDAETLDPRYATDAVALRTTRLIHAGLVRLDASTLAPEPYLAKSWRWEDDLTLRVELRTDVRFHSGASFGPRDVIATIAAFQSPKVASRLARVVEDIGTVTPDGDAIRITLKRAHATLLTDLEVPILRADEADGPPRIDGTLDGLGPFKVSTREDGAIALVPADNAALPKPAHAVTIRTVHDENARALRMHAGRADLVVNGFSPTLLPSLATAPGVSIVARPGANLTYMMVQSERAGAPYGALISRAIDRARLASTLFAGHATPATTVLPETLWAHTAPAAAPKVEPPTKVDPPVHLTLLTSTDRFRITVARQIAQDLAVYGLELEVIPLELGTMLARLNAGDFDLATLQMPEITEPNVLRFFLHSTNVPPAGANRGRLRDARVDALLDRAASERQPDLRKAMYAELETALRERALFLPLWHEDQIAVTSTRAASFAPSAEGRWLALATLTP